MAKLRVADPAGILRNPVKRRVKWSCAPLAPVAPGNRLLSSRSMSGGIVPGFCAADANAPVLSKNVPVYDQKLIGCPSTQECTKGKPIGNAEVANHASGGTSAAFKLAASLMSAVPAGKQSLLPLVNRHTTIAWGPLPVRPDGTVNDDAR